MEHMYNCTKPVHQRQTFIQNGSVSFSESFDPDDPTLIDGFPDYTTETDLGERPPTPTPRREKNSMRKASKKKKTMSAIPQ